VVENNNNINGMRKGNTCNGKFDLCNTRCLEAMSSGKVGCCLVNTDRTFVGILRIIFGR
jgi:hypothetical protein